MIIKIKTIVKENNSKKNIYSKGMYFLHILVSAINKWLGLERNKG